MGSGRFGLLALLAIVALALQPAQPSRSVAAEPDDPTKGPQAGLGAAAAGDPTDDDGDSSLGAAQGQNVFAPPDRATLRLVARARQLMDQDRYAEAVRCLGAVFESPQDYFFHPDKNDPVPRSLKAEAQRMLGEMSLRGRQLYELQYGARARQMLSAATAAGDAAGLAEVSRRFFHTQAGYEATLLLGLCHLDHGRPLAGALALERLRDASPTAEQFEPGLSLAVALCWIRAGMPEKAGQTLSMLEERHPEATLQITGDEIRLFGQNRDPLGWLTELVGPQMAPDVRQSAQWAVFRGNAARNASTAGDGPLLTTRWRVPASDHPYVEAMIDRIRDADREWDRSALPALHPIVVDDVVLMRTASGLLAVDFTTGKRIWRAPVDDPFDVLLNPPTDVLYRQTPQMEYALRLRMWADATYGRISSDGQCVFAVEDLGLEIGRMLLRTVFVGGRRVDDPAGPKPYNRLAAYDVHNGKLKWHVGGSPDEFGLPQAGTFFLGPPLPLMGRLYVIAETMGEIRLTVLDSNTGELLWSQQLAGTDQLLVKDPLRRMAGVSPSYADGVLVCPTSNRSVVAVQLATRSLLWGYTYQQADSRRERQVAFFGARSIIDPNPIGRWIDSSVILAEGRVLVSPVDSDYLDCLNLVDGKLLWREPRQDDLYLACVHQGKAVLVGGRHVRALDLHNAHARATGIMPVPPVEQEPQATPQGPVTCAPESDRPEQDHYQRPAPAWDGRTVELPPGSVPSGIGFLGGDLYYLPLSTAEVMAIELATGRTARVSKSRQGSVPGNLISHKGKILSQDATGLEAYYQLEALREQVDRRLAADGDDAEALALRGEILWDEGKLEEAIGCFRSSLERRPDPNTRELLRDALFDGLRTQFAARRHEVDQIQQLIDGPDEQAMYLRLMAVGLAASGEFRPALEHYLKLIDLDSDHRRMEPVDKSLSVRRDRWIQVQLAALREAAPADVQTEIDQVAARRLEAAVAQDTPQAVRRFLEYFGAQPIAQDARRHLVKQFLDSGELLGAELLLARRERSATRELRAGAVAELGDVLRRVGHLRDAAVCYARLNREFAQVDCGDGKTGREVVEALPADDPIRDRLTSVSPWPVGRVVVAKSKPEATPQSTQGQATLLFDGSRAPFFSDVTVELHQTPLPELVACNGLGRTEWKLPLTDLASQGHFLLNRGLMRLSVCGHLLFLVSGQRIMAVDTLGAAVPSVPDRRSPAEYAGTPRILWSRDLDQPGADPFGPRGLRLQLANLAGGAAPLRLATYPHDPISTPRTVSEQVVVFKRFGNCIAVDPWTGQTLWVRRDLPRDAEVFGDHEYLFVVRPGETTATVLRASDGKLLDQREVPLEREKTFGRRVLVWRAEEGKRVLEMVDPWEDRKLWASGEFGAEATLRYVADEAAAVFEPAGRFVLVNLDDGHTMLDTKLQPEQPLSEILVLPSPDQYLLLLYNRNPMANRSRQTFAMHGVASERVAQGQVYAFDRQGKELWPSPAVVDNQWLPLSQPSRLPVLVFACMVQERQANAPTQTKTSILCLDRRNGREVCREELPSPSSRFGLVGDPEKGTVRIELQKDTITMTFTDQPLAPESDEASAPGDQASGGQWNASEAVQAVWRTIRHAITGKHSESNDP